MAKTTARIRTSKLTLCFSFIDSSNWYQNHCSEVDRKKILVHFHAPDILSNESCTNLNGYCGSQSSFSEVGGKDKLDSLSTFSIVLYY